MRPRALPLAVLAAALLAHAAPAAAEPTAAELTLAELAQPGPLAPRPNDARALSLRFLEWSYLCDWVERDLAGEGVEESPGRWARARGLRLGDAPAPAWDLQRRQRGVCVGEQRGFAPTELAALCDSLRSGSFTPAALLVEGILTGHLLAAAGLPGCGDAGDPAAALAESLGDPPRLGLEALKEGRDYAALFFAAEREVEQARLAGLERVREFLARPGLLVSVKYGHRSFEELTGPGGPVALDEAHLLYPRGVKAVWDASRSLAVDGLPVLHTPEQNLLQVVLAGEGLALFKEDGDGRALAPVQGSYALEGPFRFEAAGIRLAGDGGRCRYDDAELRLWWPSNFLAANRRGFLFSLLIIAVTAFLMIQNRRRRRELARPYTRPRPKV